MKASKKFSYYVDGNKKTLIKVGEEVPEVARPYAEKKWFAESGSGYKGKAKPAPANKAKPAPKNKA